MGRFVARFVSLSTAPINPHNLKSISKLSPGDNNAEQMATKFRNIRLTRTKQEIMVHTLARAQLDWESKNVLVPKWQYMEVTRSGKSDARFGTRSGVRVRSFFDN